MPFIKRDWVSDPSTWQRIVLSVAALPSLGLGLSFLAPAIWSLFAGGFCALCFWFGSPVAILGLVLGSAAVLPVGGRRDAIMSIVMVLFATSLVVFIIVALRVGL